MKKTGLTFLLVTLAIVAGYASVRVQPGVGFPPHTITYRLTSFDSTGSVTRTSVVIRKVLSDGTWSHTQINPDGPVIPSKGKMKHMVTSEAVRAELPQHLGFKYVETRNASSETWVSPELQDFLRFVELREDGSKASVLEAVAITAP